MTNTRTISGQPGGRVLHSCTRAEFTLPGSAVRRSTIGGAAGLAIVAALLLLSARVNGAPPAGAEEGKSVPSDADGFRSLVAELLERNPDVRAARGAWLAALSEVDAAGVLPDPKITVGQFAVPVETRVGPQRRRYGVKQTFPWPGKLALQRRRQEEEAAAAHARYERVQLSIFSRFCRAYAQYYLTHRSLAVTRQVRELLTDLERVARVRYRTGGSLAPLSQLQVEIARLDDRLASLEERITPLRSQLNALLNRPADVPVTVIGGPAIETALSPVDEQTVAALVEEANPELKELRALVRKQRTNVALAEKRFYPDFTLGVDYVETDSARMAGVDDSGKDPLMFVATVNIPLWRSAYRADVRSAQERERALGDRVRAVARRLRADLDVALFRYHDAQRKIALYRDALLPKAREAMEVTRRAFEAGKADFLNLVDTERTLLTFELAIEEARADVLTYTAALWTVSGRLPPAFGRPSTGRPTSPGARPRQSNEERR